MIKIKNEPRNLPDIIIFTDGASSGNPGPGGWGSIIIQKQNLVFELGGGEKHTTNNRMELTAVIEALSYLESKLEITDQIEICTDSSYVINGITKWIYSWEKRNWITVNKEPVLNKDLWEKLLEQVKLKTIKWKHVKGHSGITGNERADQIAQGFSQNNVSELFSGDINDYDFKDILSMNSTNDKSVTKNKSKNRKSKGGYYISKVDGKVMKYKTWEECKKDVIGVKGAKFKKVSNEQEENDTLKSWG